MLAGRARIFYGNSSTMNDPVPLHSPLPIYHMDHDTRISLSPCMHLSHLLAGMAGQVVTTTHNIEASMITTHAYLSCMPGHGRNHGRDSKRDVIRLDEIV